MAIATIPGDVLLELSGRAQPAFQQLCEDLGQALQQQGCCVIRLNHQHSQLLASAMASTSQYEAFFDKSSSSDKRLQQGYQQLQGKQLFEYRSSPAASAPGDDQQWSEQSFWHLDTLSRQLLTCLSRSTVLGGPVPPARLADLCDITPLPATWTSSSLMHASKYEAGCPSSSPCCSPHVDRGLLTLVMSQQVAGLQVQLGEANSHIKGEWVDVPLGPGRVALMVGYTLGQATGGVLQPCRHRVRLAGGSSRTSLAFKLRGRDGAVVDPGSICEGLQAAAAVGSVGAPGPLTVRQLMARFEAEHPMSVNRLWGQQQAGQQQAGQQQAGQQQAGQQQQQQVSVVPANPLAPAAAPPAAPPPAAVAPAARSGAVKREQEQQQEAGPSGPAAKRLRPSPADGGACAAKPAPQATDAVSTTHAAATGREAGISKPAAAAGTAAAEGAATGRRVGAVAAAAAARQPGSMQPTPSPGQQRLNITVHMKNGHACPPVGFIVLPVTRLELVMQAFTKKRDEHGCLTRQQHRLGFRHNGQWLNMSDTVGSLRLKNEDILLCYERPTGRAAPKPLGIVVRDQAGGEMQIKIEPYIVLQEVEAAYCRAKSLDRHACKFLYDGVKIQDGDTAEILGLATGDSIDVVIEQIGD